MITNIFFLGMVYLNKKRKLCSTYNIPWYIFCIYYLHVFLLIKDYHTQILCSPTFKGGSPGQKHRWPILRLGGGPTSGTPAG